LLYNFWFGCKFSTRGNTQHHIDSSLSEQWYRFKQSSTTASTTNPVYVQILARTGSGDSNGAVVNYSDTATQAKATYDSTANKFYYAAQYSAGAGAIIPEAQNVNAVVTYTITYP
jgi:hypothetical protein